MRKIKYRRILRVKEIVVTIFRIKEIIITAGGENVAPTNIEEEIKSELPEVWTNVEGGIINLNYSQTLEIKGSRICLKFDLQERTIINFQLTSNLILTPIS